MKIQKNDYPILKVLENGGISLDGFGEGRFFPFLSVEDTYEKLNDYIRFYHNNIASGDVTIRWAKPLSLFKTKIVILVIEFTKPEYVKIGIEFIISKQFPTIDCILNSKGLMLKTGKKGEKISDSITEPNIFVEVTDAEFVLDWGKTLISTLVDKYKSEGYAKKEAKNRAFSHIKSMREFHNVRRKT